MRFAGGKGYDKNNGGVEVNFHPAIMFSFVFKEMLKCMKICSNRLLEFSLSYLFS